jgi:hypothetical protein
MLVLPARAARPGSSHAGWRFQRFRRMTARIDFFKRASHIKKNQRKVPLMKLLSATLLALALLAGAQTSQAQSDIIAKQRARNIRDANNLETPVTPPSTGAPNVPAPPSPGISPEQQQNINKLGTDFGVFQAGATATDAQKTQLQTDLMTLAKGSVRPSKESLKKLVDDLAAALAGKDAALKQPAQLAANLNVVVNSANLSPPRASDFIDGAQTLLKKNGVAEADAQKVGDDLRAIAAELRKGRAKLYQ